FQRAIKRVPSPVRHRRRGRGAVASVEHDGVPPGPGRPAPRRADRALIPHPRGRRRPLPRQPVHPGGLTSNTQIATTPPDDRTAPPLRATDGAPPTPPPPAPISSLSD